MQLQAFKERFFALTEGWQWEVEGFIDKTDTVYPIDTDTKVLSTIFERLASPVLHKIAEENGYTIELANQTVYPDFTFTQYNGSEKVRRIAVDVKTTYRSTNMKLTLGSYTSFLINGTKNIKYPYSTYDDHWVIGFIYSRSDHQYPSYTVDNMPTRGELPCPYKNVNIFIRAKHEITGLRPGSGNTANIGSISVANADDFVHTQGPFCQFRNGKRACDYFWRHFPRLKDSIRNSEQLLRHEEFQEFGSLK